MSNDNQEDREMPRYRSHKIVRAVKITRVINLDGLGSKLEGEGYGVFMAPAGWCDRFKPGKGAAYDMGYYVVYDDGYASWSPTKAFEEGYSRLDESAPS